jgi:hypothetical protein
LLKRVRFESFDTSEEAGTRPQTEWDGDYVRDAYVVMRPSGMDAYVVTNYVWGL